MPVRREGTIVGFTRGLAEPWRGLLFLLGHPGLWPLAVLPFLVGMILYAGALAVGWHFMHGWLESAFRDRAGAWMILEYLVAALYWVLALVVLAVAYVPLAVLVASPFNDLLSEMTERLYLRVKSDRPFSLGEFLRTLRVGLFGELARSLTLALWLLLAFSLHFIPVVGSIVATVASAVATIWYVSLEFTSYSMDRRFFTWSQRKAFLSRFRARTLGFGAMAFAIMLIPIVNALFIPIHAVAGTLLFCDTALRE